MKNLLLSLAVVVLIAPAVRADKDDKLPASDPAFLAHAISCSVAQTKYADLAEKRAGSKEVQEFARKLKEDHNKCNEKLLEFAKGAKVAVVSGLEKDQREALSNLSKLTGTEFDKAYLRRVIEDHEKALTVLEDRKKATGNADLRDHVSKSITTVKEHLDEARKLLKIDK